MYIYIYDSCLLIYLIDVYKKCISIPHFPPSIPMIYGSLILFQDQVLEVNGDMVNGDDSARKLENESQVQNRCRHRSGYGAATGFENQGYGSKNKTRKTKHLKGTDGVYFFGINHPLIGASNFGFRCGKHTSCSICRSSMGFTMGFPRLR